MKIDRHLAILNLLTENKTITAPFLAERLEVSRRTISRDIEDLCKAGIPIVTKQGNQGGISLMDGYIIDKTLLKEGDLENIIVALRGLNTISPAKNIDMLLAKLEDTHSSSASDNAIMIDLSSHYKPSLSIKIDIFRKAIKSHMMVIFDYYGPREKTTRKVEPYKVVFRWSDWYLFSYCPERDDFRLFKLNRLWNESLSNTSYTPRLIPKEKLEFDNHFIEHLPFEAIFDKSVEYLLVESYGPHCYKEENSKLHFSGNYTNLHFITNWLLGFGNKATVLSPPELVNHIKKNSYKF